MLCFQNDLIPKTAEEPLKSAARRNLNLPFWGNGYALSHTSSIGPHAKFLPLSSS